MRRAKTTTLTCVQSSVLFNGWQFKNRVPSLVTVYVGISQSFFSHLSIIVTSPYQWKIHLRNEKEETNKLLKKDNVCMWVWTVKRELLNFLSGNIMLYVSTILTFNAKTRHCFHFLCFWRGDYPGLQHQEYFDFTVFSFKLGQVSFYGSVLGPCKHFLAHMNWFRGNFSDRMLLIVRSSDCKHFTFSTSSHEQRIGPISTNVAQSKHPYRWREFKVFKISRKDHNEIRSTLTTLKNVVLQNHWANVK